MCEYVCICDCVCVCKLDIGTWKMKVNSMATQSYFCPSIHLSVLLTLSQFWIPLSPYFLPAFFSSPCHAFLSPPVQYVWYICGHISPGKPVHLFYSSHTSISDCTAPYPEGMTVILRLRGYYSSAPHWLSKCIFFYNSQSKIISAVLSWIVSTHSLLDIVQCSASTCLNSSLHQIYCVIFHYVVGFFFIHSRCCEVALLLCLRGKFIGKFCHSYAGFPFPSFSSFPHPFRQ